MKAPINDAPQHVLLLAQLSATISSITSINVTSLREAILFRLQETGVVVSSRGVLHKTLEKWFSSTVVAAWCRTDDLSMKQLAGGEWIAAMLWRQRRSHPVLWPVLWTALEWRRPEEATEAFEDAIAGRTRRAGGQITLFDDHTPGPTQAPEQVRSAFMHSGSYQDVMQQLGVSRDYIIRWLDMDPELRGAWKAKLRAGRQTKCEQAIRDAVLNGDVTTRVELESRCAAEVRWMREHAPAKLAAMLRSMPARLAVQPTLFDGLHLQQQTEQGQN